MVVLPLAEVVAVVLPNCKSVPEIGVPVVLSMTEKLTVSFKNIPSTLYLVNGTSSTIIRTASTVIGSAHFLRRQYVSKDTLRSVLEWCFSITLLVLLAGSEVSV